MSSDKGKPIQESEVVEGLSALEKEDASRHRSIIEKLSHLQHQHQDAKRQLLIGREIEELRFAVTKSHGDADPQTAVGRLWGGIIQFRLAKIGLSRTSTYRRVNAWESAVKLGIPEEVLIRIANDDRMAGVAVDGDSPFGKRFTAHAKRLAKNAGRLATEEGISAAIEEMFAAPKPQPKEVDEAASVAALINQTLSALRNTMKANNADVTNVTLSRQWLGGLIGNLMFALDYPQGTHNFEAPTAPFAANCKKWSDVIKTDQHRADRLAKLSEAKAAKTKKLEEQKAAKDAKAEARQTKREKKAKRISKKQKPTVVVEPESGLMTTRGPVSPHGYYWQLNRKPKNATETNQPYEIFHESDPTKVLTRDRNSQDAAMAAKRLDDKAAFKPDTQAEGAAAGA